MKLSKVKQTISELKYLGNKKKKKICFLISNTSKKYKGQFYITPIRESLRAVYCGAVVFGNKITKEISKIIDSKVDYVYVDIEKKVNNNNDILVNTEREVKENIKYSIVKNYKSNDITVNSIENFIQDYFSSDIRGIGGKKILIIGAGNIGSKLGLRLLESGGYVTLFRRNLNKLKNITKTLNILKPRQTKSNCKYTNYKKLNLTKFDVIVGCNNKPFKINLNKNSHFKKKSLIIDVGKGVFSKNIFNKIISQDQTIFRLDIEGMLSSFIDSTIQTESFFKNKHYYEKFQSFNLVKKGVLGKKGDIIVDDVINPKKIIGICDDNGELKTVTNKKLNLLNKKILKNEK